MGASKGRPKPEGSGRGKGVENVITQDLRTMAMGSLAAVGGQKYLEQQAIVNPVAYMTFIGKFVPRDVVANVNANITFGMTSEQKLEMLQKIIANAETRGNDR